MAAAPIHNFRGDLKISDQNNWGDLAEQKIKFGGNLNFQRGGRAMNPDDVMIVVSKDVLLC